MEPKRPAEAPPADAPPRKRTRWDDGPAAPDAAAKAAAVAAKQSELAQKLARLRAQKAPAVAPGAAGPPPPPPPGVPAAAVAEAAAKAASIAARLVPKTGFSAAPALLVPPAPGRARPAALRLDAQGREIDATGAVITTQRPTAAPTLAVNARQKRAEDGRAALDAARTALLAEGGDAATRKRDQRALRFVAPGALSTAAEESRLQAALAAQFGDAAAVERRRLEARTKRREAEAARIAGYNAVTEDGAAVPLGEDVPAVEWWDLPLLGGASYDEVLSGAAPLVDAKISIYVEHPVPIAPPPTAQPPPPPPQPLKLTVKEAKKLRTQRRIAREAERQEMLRQGLLEPPKPKVRLANLMRVLGAEATADPTAVEKEVQRQVAERAAAHEDRNAARKLTPAERREKKKRKLFADGAGCGETLACVYRIERLDSRLNEYKVVVNAEENALSGCLLKTDAFALVVVEGGRKAVERYRKLMLRRIDWALVPEAAEEDEEAAEVAAEGAPGAGAANRCTLVWQGVVGAPAFKRFKFEPIRNSLGAAKFLADLGLRSYWDLAAAGVPVE